MKRPTSLLLVLACIFLFACQDNSDIADDDGGPDIFDEEVPDGTDDDETDRCTSTVAGSVWVDDRSYPHPNKKPSGDGGWLWTTCDSGGAYYAREYDVLLFEEQARIELLAREDEFECPVQCPNYQVVLATSAPAQMGCHKQFSSAANDTLFYFQLRIDYAIFCRDSMPTEQIGVPDEPPASPPISDDCIYVGQQGVGWTCWRGRWIQAIVYTWWCPETGWEQRLEITEESSQRCPAETPIQFDEIDLL